MPTPVSDLTLENFRAAAASSNPTPAGVALAAVSASLGLGLLAKVVIVSGRRKEFSGNLAKLEALAGAAQAESKRMLQLAQEDMAAFDAYMASARLPRSTDQERGERQRAIDSAIRKTIDVPLAAARAAASGLELCAKASGLTHPAVIADLGAAATLLSGALRVFLMCAESNIRQLAAGSSSYGDKFAAGTEWQQRAFRQEERVLEHVAATLAAPKQKSKP